MTSSDIRPHVLRNRMDGGGYCQIRQTSAASPVSASLSRHVEMWRRVYLAIGRHYAAPKMAA